MSQAAGADTGGARNLTAQMFGGCPEGLMCPPPPLHLWWLQGWLEGSGLSNSRVPGPTSLGERKKTGCWGMQVSGGSQGSSYESIEV